MPIARVQLPDGKVARLEVPEGTTPDQVESFVFNGMKAGKPESAAAKDTRLFQEQIKKDAAPTKLERFGRGFADITQGVKQGALSLKDLVTGSNDADAYTKEKTEELNRYEKDRGPDAGVDLMRLGGNVAATLPISMLIPGSTAASLGARSAAGAAQGAAAGSSFFTPEGQSKAGQIVAGGLSGGAMPAVFNAVKRAVSPIVSKVGDLIRPKALPSLEGEISIKLDRQGIDWNKLTQAAKATMISDAQKALETGGTLDDAMLANKATIEAIGAKGTKSAVTRSPRDYQLEKNMRGIDGVGDEIVSRNQSDAKAMVDYLSALRGKSGGKAATALEAGESAVTAIKANDREAKNAVDNLYSVYRESGQGHIEVPETKLTNRLTDILENVGEDNIPGAVKRRLQEFGFLGGERTRYLTVEQADKFNRLLNANDPGFGPSSKVVNSLRGALNESLIDTPGGGELLTRAREAAADRFAAQRASTGVAAAVKDVAPDRFVKRFILDAPVRDLRATLAELKKSPTGEQAIKDIKGHVLDNLLLKSTGATATDDVAGKAFSGVRFGKALDAIEPEKLHQIFSPEEIGSLRTLQKASKLLTEEVPFSDVNHSKTASALANLFLKIGNTPLLGQLVSPIIGTAKVGMDWVQNANARKQVAEALLASAVKEGPKKQLPVFRAERFLPAGAVALSQGDAQQ